MRMRLDALAHSTPGQDDAVRGRDLLLTWLACLAVRVGCVAGLGTVTSYTFFAEGLQDNSYWYPGYMALARGLWTLTAGHVPSYIAVHVGLATPASPGRGLVRIVGTPVPAILEPVPVGVHL